MARTTQKPNGRSQRYGTQRSQAGPSQTQRTRRHVEEDEEDNMNMDEDEEEGEGQLDTLEEVRKKC